MKNATKYAEKLRALHRSLMRDGRPAPLQPMEPLRALVRGAMLYDVTETRADQAMKAIESEFVDLNELRVATELEVHELLGQRYPAIEQRVQMITRCLNAIFEREHTLSLERLRTLSKRDARQFLRELPDISPFVEGYVSLVGFEVAAVPVDDSMVQCLKSEGAADESANADEVQRFIEHQLRPEDCADFFVAAHRLATDENARRKRK